MKKLFALPDFFKFLIWTSLAKRIQCFYPDNINLLTAQYKVARLISWQWYKSRNCSKKEVVSQPDLRSTIYILRNNLWSS